MELLEGALNFDCTDGNGSTYVRTSRAGPLFRTRSVQAYFIIHNFKPVPMSNSSVYGNGHVPKENTLKFC